MKLLVEKTKIIDFCCAWLREGIKNKKKNMNDVKRFEASKLLHLLLSVNKSQLFVWVPLNGYLFIFGSRVKNAVFSFCMGEELAKE